MNKKERRQKSILPGAVGVKVVSYQKKNHKTGKVETISDIAGALRSFKKELKESGKLDELKERRYHIPKSAKNREKMKRARYFQWVSDQNAD